MTFSSQLNEQLSQCQKLGTIKGIEEIGVTIVKIRRESMSIKIWYEPIIITHSEGLENEPIRIQGGILA